jgi:MarR family transcriptional regulator, organic hydroperoxide resistance regulator
MSESIQFSQTVRKWMDVFMQRSMSGWRQYVRASGLSMPQFSILMRLNYRGGCGISNISEHMDISTAAASQLVDKLVQAGLLERTEDPHDRRARQVTLSPKGREFIAQGIEQRYRWVDEMAPKLSLEEQAQITDALNIMIRAAEELEADPV